MKKIVFILIIIYSFELLAQSPGYMGKRVSAGYGFYASPGWVGSSGHTPLNMLHEAFLEAAVKKRLSVGFSARFYNAVYGNGRYVYINSNTYSDYSKIDDHPNGTTQIKGRNYMLYFKLFDGNYVAPWGRYFTFGATINTFESSYNSNDMYVLYSQYNSYPISTYEYKQYSNFGPKAQNYTRFDVMLGFGRSRIIAKRITLDYGYNINLIAMALTLFDAPDDNVLSENYLYASEYIEKTSAARIRGVNRFNFFLKLGFLLF